MESAPHQATIETHQLIREPEMNVQPVVMSEIVRQRQLEMLDDAKRWPRELRARRTRQRHADEEADDTDDADERGAPRSPSLRPGALAHAAVPLRGRQGPRNARALGRGGQENGPEIAAARGARCTARGSTGGTLGASWRR